tara:strand:+ start:1674 stop:1796 length:123 start_codon:yes stop_codon:yes gene_type:complete
MVSLNKEAKTINVSVIGHVSILDTDVDIIPTDASIVINKA